MSGFNFRLYLDSGEDIGTFSTAVPDWKIGDEFYNRDHNQFRILDIVTDFRLSSRSREQLRVKFRKKCKAGDGRDAVNPRPYKTTNSFSDR